MTAPLPPAIIFDLDGTLIDSVPDIHASVQQAFASRGQQFSRAEVQGFVGKGAPNLVARLAESRGLSVEGPEFDALMRDFLAIYENATALTTLYPGVVTTLDALVQSGLRLGLCTNKPLAPTHSVLAHFDLARLFGAVTGGDSLSVKKPDPLPLLATADQLGGGQIIYVGDSEVDAETAVAANVPFLLFTEGYRKTPVSEMAHTAIFSDFSKLPALIAGLRS